MLDEREIHLNDVLQAKYDGIWVDGIVTNFHDNGRIYIHFPTDQPPSTRLLKRDLRWKTD